MGDDDEGIVRELPGMLRFDEGPVALKEPDM
jgi:hypothetical protein